MSLVWDDLRHAGAQGIVYDVLGAKVMKATTNGVIDIESLAPSRYTVVASIRDAKVTLPLMVK